VCVHSGHALCFLATMSSIARRFGYPSVGCSPAEPTSVSPKFYDLGGRLLGGMRMGSVGSLLRTELISVNG
jgi:hypothetical protein